MSTMAGIGLSAAARIRELEQQIDDARDSETAVRKAAAEIIDAQASEIDSLRSDLRQARDLLAGFRPVAQRELHIEVDDVNKTYTVQRRFLREYGTFDTWKAAVARREQIHRVISALPFGGELSLDEQCALDSARGD